MGVWRMGTRLGLGRSRRLATEDARPAIAPALLVEIGLYLARLRVLRIVRKGLFEVRDFQGVDISLSGRRLRHVRADF